MSKPVCFLTVVYSLLVIVLGVMGYRVKESLISFIVGGGLGLLLLIASIYMFMNKTRSIYYAAGITLVLGIAFAVRFAKTSSFMPAAMALFSAAVFVSHAIQIYRMHEKVR